MEWSANPAADAWGAGNEGGFGTTTAADATWNAGENVDNDAFHGGTAGAVKEEYGGDDGGRDCYNCGETG